MSYCTYIDPKTGKRGIGSLDENGQCFLNYHSRLEEFFKDQDSLQLFKDDPLLHQNAPDFFIPDSKALAPFDRFFSTQDKPLDEKWTPENLPDSFPEITQLFEKLTCVLENFGKESGPENLLPQARPEESTTTSHDVPVIDHSLHQIIHENPCDSLWDQIDEVVSMLRKHFKVTIPFLPQLSRILSPRKSLYFLHMLWYIREYMDPNTGIAKFRSKYMAYYMAMCARTENRLRDFFVGKNVFNCIYDRKSHLLNMSVNWEGLNLFLTSLDPKLCFLSKKEEKPGPQNEKLKDLSKQSPSKQPQETLKASKVTFEMTKEHKSSFKWFDSYIHKDPNTLSPSQLLTALKDLGTAPLLSTNETSAGFEYILYDKDHALKPYLNAAGMDAFFVLEALTQTHPNLIPAIRPLSDCPDYYYKGEELENPKWRPRERVTYAFTKRIAHLMGFDSYATMAGHMSIIEWNQNTLLEDGSMIPEFLIATRNGPMAAILGVFFTHLMHRFKDNFRFHIIPLQPHGILTS